MQCSIIIHFVLVYIFGGAYLTKIYCDDINFRDDGSLEVGSKCRFKHNNTLGQCTNAADCPAVLHEYRHLNLAPTPCVVHDSNNMIVCCHGEYYTGFEEPPSILNESPIKNSRRKSAACEFNDHFVYSFLKFA